jgi:benzoyl-CoA reductase/2-hydroxyglutaryl-CoA dehydratase subunit BcrC/BadD/HgdB
MVGFTTTIPLEILVAAGRRPVDLNNIFITDPDPQGLIEEAEFAGFPRNICGWIKGIYSVALSRGIREIIEGHSLETLCAGVNNTLIKRVAPMLRRFPRDIIVLTGGVAKSPAFFELLHKATGADIRVPEHPQHNGAIGCAHVAEKDAGG